MVHRIVPCFAGAGPGMDQTYFSDRAVVIATTESHGVGCDTYA